MSFKRKGSQYRSYDFTLDGPDGTRHRFRGSTGQSEKRAADDIEAAIRAQAQRRLWLEEKPAGAIGAAQAPGRPSITVDEAFKRFTLEHAQYLASFLDVGRSLTNLLANIPGTLPLEQLAASHALAHVTARRQQAGPRTVNSELEWLRALVNRATRLWGVQVPAPPIVWTDLFLETPDEPDRPLSVEQELAFFSNFRPDLHDMADFSLATRLRLNNVITLTWPQVDRAAGFIRVRTKSRKPGGRILRVPITQRVAQLLDRQKGRHKLYVFTYEVKRRFRHARFGWLNKGDRCPFSQDGHWRHEWAKAVKAAGLEGFRFHDLRHTGATRLLKATGSLELVQKSLGHRDIRTTARYARSVVDDIRAGMEAEEAMHTQLTRSRVVNGTDDVE